MATLPGTVRQADDLSVDGVGIEGGWTEFVSRFGPYYCVLDIFVSFVGKHDSATQSVAQVLVCSGHNLPVAGYASFDSREPEAPGDGKNHSV